MSQTDTFCISIPVPSNAEIVQYAAFSRVYYGTSSAVNPTGYIVVASLRSQCIIGYVCVCTGTLMLEKRDGIGCFCRNHVMFYKLLAVVTEH